MSLVVSTVGRPTALWRLIESLAPELAAGPTVELIVVDQSEDGCCLPVLRQADEVGLAPDLRWLYTRSARGASRGRNVGLGLAQGDLIMFPDDDAWFSGTTLAQSTAHLDANPDHDGLCTQLRDGDGRLSMLRWAPTARLVTKLNHHRTSIGSTMLFRAPAARTAVGFDEGLGPGSAGWFGSCEDADFLLRVIEGGATVWYDPSVVMHHRDSRRDGGAEAERKALAYGCGQGFMWRRHRFPRWLILGLLARRLFGGFVWSLRGRGDIGRAHRAWLRGAVSGWYDQRPVDLDDNGRRGPVAGLLEGPSAKEFGRSFGGRIIAALLGTTATFALTTMAVRNLDATEVTVFYAVLAALMIGPIVGRLGLHQRAVQVLATIRTQARPEVVAAQARRRVAAASWPPILTAPILALSVVWLTPLSEFDVGVVTLVAIVLASEALRLTASDVLTGLGLTSWGTVLAHQGRAVVVAIVIGLSLWLSPGSLDLDAVLVAMAVVGVALTAIGFYRVWTLPADRAALVEDERRDRSLRIRQSLKLGLPFLTVDLVVVVAARGDVWLAAATLGEETAAIYSTASVLGFQIATPIGLANVALAPVVAGHVAQGRFDELERLVRTLVTAATFLILPAFAAIVVFGEDLLALMYGEAYRGAHRYLVLLMAGNLALATLGIASAVLLMAGRERVAMTLAGGWLAIAAPCSVVAASVWGPTALAIASAGTTIGLYLLLAAAVWVTTGIPALPLADPRRMLMPRWVGGPRLSRGEAGV